VELSPGTPVRSAIDENTETNTRNKTIQKQRELVKAGAENPAKSIPAVLPELAFFHAKRTPRPLPAFRAKRSQWECWLLSGLKS